MDDGSQQPQSFGSGQQRAQHPRPFFYVQPPSQPYYLYQQWQMNNPYSHYGVPGGFNFARPCMPPYPYMQYPGYFLPQGPMYPMDYRRIFEPRFHAPSWNDAPRHHHQQQQQQQQQHQQQQHYHPQPHGRPETACSEAQTDPSDAITKLIECLDKIRATELQGAGRELDSGVASQSSGMFSPGEEKKSEEQGHTLPSVPDDSAAVTFSDSTTAVYDGESSHRSLDVLSPPGCWSAGLEEELPLDSSSIHEECPELEQSVENEHFLSLETAEVADIQSDIPATDQSVPTCDGEKLLKQKVDPVLPSSASNSREPGLTDAKSGDTVSKTDQKADPGYQILRLPFDSVLTPGDAAAARLPSPTAPYYYNYLSMQTTHERMSVLSPSLDELSSRDEMFSTDLDDADLFPKRVYAGRRLADVVSGSPKAAEGVEEVWLPGSKRFMCACCGKSLAKGAARSKVHSSKVYRDDGGDSEEDGRYGRGCEQPVRVVVRKHSAHRKPHSVPPRHAAKPWYKRGQYKDPPNPVNQEESHNVCTQEPADGEPEEMTSSEMQCRTCQDRLCREDLTTSDQGRWGDGDVIPRRRQAAPLQRQEMSTQRKVMYHRPRDEDNDDDEPPPLHWERGSTMRGEPRC
ncbi:bucky ball [Centropristis striata]|uniref:bucky ball n=1 Tax=Centropristis striata TaxID=184440 RepID=UPI0027E0D535|nr:bucky ball [Centropristis striata]